MEPADISEEERAYAIQCLMDMGLQEDEAEYEVDEFYSL